MKFYRKRNIHHPIILVDNKPVPWIRIASFGVISTEDAATIKVLDEAAEKSKGQVQEITKEQFDVVLGEEKKTQQPSVRRTFPPRDPTSDRGRSAPSQAPSVTPSNVSPAPGAAPVKTVGKPGRPAKPKNASATPVVEPPPGVSGLADETPIEP